MCDAAGHTPIDVVLRATCCSIKKSEDTYEVHTWGDYSFVFLFYILFCYNHFTFI